MNWDKNKTTMKDPLTGVEMCRACWDGNHRRGGCGIPACKCGCYQGRQEGLSGNIHPPSKELVAKLPDAGAIEIQ